MRLTQTKARISGRNQNRDGSAARFFFARFSNDFSYWV